jgi:hypothetical protein
MNAKIMRNILLVSFLFCFGSWKAKEIIPNITPLIAGGPVLCNSSYRDGEPVRAISIIDDQSLAKKHIPLVI